MSDDKKPEEKTDVQKCGKNEEELSELLDDALKDFVTPTTTTTTSKATTTSDEDLDAIMVKVDKEAAEKAAKNFETMLNQMIDTMRDEDREKSAAAGCSKRKLKAKSTKWNKAKSFMGDLLNADEGEDEAELFSAFTGAFSKLPLSQEDSEGFLETMVTTAVSKQVMYSPLKQMYEKFGPYLESKRGIIEPERLKKHEAQYKILGRLMQLYEEEGASSSTTDQAAATLARNKEIARLWMEMQEHGMPPEELAPENRTGGVVDECLVM